MNQHQSTDALDSSKSPFITTKELALLLNRQPQTIRKWLCTDKLPAGLPRPRKFSKDHCWLRVDVEKFISDIFTG